LFKKLDENINKIYVINSDYNSTDFQNTLILDIDDMFTTYNSISARPQF
jgi:hypothetical protein